MAISGTTLVSLSKALDERAKQLETRARILEANEMIAAAKFNISSARKNAEVSLENEIFVRSLTVENVKRLREDTGRKVGSLRARLAANGVVVDQDSALELALEQAKQGELKALDEQMAGDVRARAYRLSAEQYQREEKRGESALVNIYDAFEIQNGSDKLSLLGADDDTVQAALSNSGNTGKRQLTSEDIRSAFARAKPNYGLI